VIYILFIALTWRIVYIGQASDADKDQILEEAEMDEIQPGQMKFVFEGQPPDVSRIQESEIVGVTGVLVTCSYAQQEFFRVGYYVNNYYEEPELAENPPERPLIDRLTRHILVEKPRVTKFQIQWGEEPLQQQQMIGGFGGMINQEQ
jgi:histone chaperone ASF1